MTNTLSYAVSGPDLERLASVFADPEALRALAVRTDDDLVELPPAAAEAVRSLLLKLASGASVLVVVDDAELTTQQAADLLGISRTYLVRLIDEAKVPAHMVGTHRRLHAGDVVRYRTARDERLKAAAAITEADAEAGVPYR
jgi:excisionase family DNA binding protein